MIEELKVTQREGVLVVVINRPKYYNSFDLKTIQELAHTLMKAAGDLEVSGVVISGEGKAFCTGGDLVWVTDYGGDPARAFHELAGSFHQAILEIRHMPKPVVVAINGMAAGGGFSMALASDFRIMESSAQLRQGYTSNGISMDGGSTYTLPRIVGMAKAMEIAAFDPSISSAQAKEWGLVTEVVEDGQSMERAVELVQDMKQRSLSSFEASKKLMTCSFDTPFEVQLEKERELLSWSGGHPNGIEGVSAFLERRKPVFNKG